MRQLYTFLTFVFLFLQAQAQCVKTIPFTENFDNTTTYVRPTTTTGIGTIDACWGRTSSPNGAYQWVPGPPAFPNTFTGPGTDHTSGSGQWMFAHYTAFTSGTAQARLLTPPISLANTTSPELIFWYHMFGFSIGSLQVQVNVVGGGGGWTTISTISGQQQTTQTAAWLSKTLNLSSYVGDTIRIRFLATRTVTSTFAQISIDDVTVQETPTCAAPTNVYTTGTTSNSTSVGWTLTTNPVQIEYGISGFTPGTGTLVTPTNNPQLISGLNGSTTYDFYVRQICPVNDTSAWSIPGQTTTSCSAPASAPFTENFDNNLWMPYVDFNNQGSLGPCWLANPPTSINSYSWFVNPNALFNNQTGPDNDHTTGSGKYMGTERFGTNSIAILRSPAIDLSTISYPELSLWYHMYGANIDKLEIQAKDANSSTPFATLMTITGQQQTSSSANWENATVSLSQFAGDTVYVRLRAHRVANSFNGNMIAIDDFSIVQGSSCPKPINFTATNIGVVDVDLSWTGTTGGSYEIKHGSVGFDPDITGTSTSAASTSKTVTGLTQSTSYDFYVRQFCTTNDTSNWAGPITLTTNCLATAPYTQNFDGSTWVTPTTVNTPGSIDDCYSRSSATTYIWTPGPEQFPSFQTGPSVDHTTGTTSGQFMFTQSITFGGTAPIIAELTTELIDLSALTIPELSFWYHMYGNQIGTLKAEINNGSGWTQIFIKSGQQQTSKTDAWKEAIINLSTYADDTIQLRFTAQKAVNGFNSEVALDDIDIHEQPSCPKPTNFSISGVTFNSANLAWTTGGATNWNIKYGAPGFTVGTLISTSSNPHTLTGLSSNTAYEVWVRDSCGAGDVSQWVGPIRFKTACAPYSVPYSEDFDGTNFEAWTFTDQNGNIDECYRRSDTVEFYWVTGPPPFASFQTGPSTDNSGSGGYMYTRTNSTLGATQTDFVTPWIDISSLTLPQLRFYTHMYGNNISKLEAIVQPINGTAQIVKTLTGQQQTSSTAAWVQQIVNLSSVTSDTIRIIFRGERTVNGFRAEIAIDDIEVSNPQNCTDPTVFTSSNATSTSIDLSWTSGNVAVASNIEYGITGFTPGTGTFIYGVTSPYTVTGLQSSTTYQFYVQDSCNWGGVSNWVGPISATTLACPQVTASFTYNANSLNVSFNANGSTGSIDNYSWSYGDGTIDSMVTSSHTYSSGGTYTVTLIASNDCGNSDTATQTITLCDTVAASYSFNNSGLTVSFDGSASLGTNISFNWLYGDGNSGSGGSVSHTYATDGTYQVSLIVTDACGNIDTLVQTITVCQPLQAAITYTQNGLQVDFDGTSFPGGVDWYWTFGDGNSSTASMPSHTYASTGTYQVTLYVSNLCGEEDTVQIILTLCNPPQAAWSYKIISSGGSGMTVQFDGTASIGANTFNWEFGDGNTNNVSAIPVHTYSVPGLFYVVKLTVYNDCGDANSFSSSLASVGIEELEDIGVNVYPNPVDEVLIISIPEFILLHEVKLIDATGKEFNSTYIEGIGQIEMNTSNLAEGTYFINVKTNVGSSVYQVVVKH